MINEINNLEAFNIKKQKNIMEKIKAKNKILIQRLIKEKYKELYTKYSEKLKNFLKTINHID